MGIASSTGLSAQSLATNFKIKNKYTTEEEILNSPEIDAVLILTPHFNHAELVIKALSKGKAIYVEKPLALTSDSLVEIEEAIYNADNPKLFIGFNRRFSEATQFVKQKLIQNPANSISFRFSVPPLDKDHWTNIKEIGGGRVVGEAIHAIDLACYLFDSLPQSISSSAPIDKENNEVNENQVAVPQKIPHKIDTTQSKVRKCFTFLSVRPRRYFIGYSILYSSFVSALLFFGDVYFSFIKRKYDRI